MPFSRRQLLAITSLTVASGIASSSRGAGAPIRAVAFDGFPIFDLRPIFALAENLFPGRGTELSNVWRTRQFEYTWLRTMTGHYRDFLGVIDDALVFACKSLAIELTGIKRTALVESYLKMPIWPDVLPALSMLRESGLRLALLSNFSPAMFDGNIGGTVLEGTFEFQLSTDAVRAYKPDPRAYHMGVDAFGLKREEILFAAFAGWDASGAKLFGYPTFWVNRQKQPREQLEAVPDGEGQGMMDLVHFLSG
ncbi:haloacid dehalogenase type II [Bradyrhizobium diazoefficiens]|uniref:haloacid dehalogenase type II n=1 Tax=Bradyrhizobium diazoefficiens TaxID=1355477 RepID=UPI00190E57C7|nr:haloacid dehalogenase type II [Bradyrhizobium diazoefficiens]QQO36029.1 haloacid dehalogenase type II [Bradyrhizobium diazoefficiens]